MKAVTAGFVAACAGPHRVTAQVDVYEANGTLAEAAVGATEWTVTLDRTAAVYGRFAGSFVGLDQTLVARLVKDRCQLRVSRGVELTPTIPKLPVWLTDENGAIITTEDGTPIYVDETAAVPGTSESFVLGWFTCTDVTQDIVTLGVEIEAMDRSFLVAEQRLPYEYQATAGTEVVTHLEAVLSAALGRAVEVSGGSDDVQAATVVVSVDDDPWRACSDMARAVGFDLRVNADGEFALVAVPDPSTATAAFTVDAATGASMVAGTIGWSWVSEAETVTVIGDNPASTDIYSGESSVVDTSEPGYGSRRRLTVRDPSIGSDDQAAAAAATVRRQQQGGTRTLDMTGTWPFAEPTDTVRIVQPAVGLDENRMIDKVTIPAIGPVRVTTRRDDLVAALKPPAPSAVVVEWVEGVVTQEAPLLVDGVSASALDSYTPTLNDKVQVHQSGGRRLVVGKVA